MLAGMRADALRLWMAYDQLEPFGEQRADLRMAIGAAATVNALQGKSGRQVKPADLMPDFGRRQRRQTVADVERVMNQLMAIHGRADPDGHH